MTPTSPEADPLVKNGLPKLGQENLISQGVADEQMALCTKIQRMSERLFPGPVSFEHTFDPEDPSCEYTVFDVTASGTFADYRDRIFQWHDEVESIASRGAGDFRLIVHPQK